MGAEGDTDVGVVQTHEENKTAKQTDIGGKHYLFSYVEGLG
jgi:hypothetical protein